MKKLKTYIGLILVSVGLYISKIGYKLSDKEEILKYIQNQVDKAKNKKIKGANLKFWG